VTYGIREASGPDPVPWRMSHALACRIAGVLPTRILMYSLAYSIAGLMIAELVCVISL
jgi:hypothetical protein